MKYAAEIIGLLAAHPGRQFRVVQIRRFIQASLPIDRNQDAVRIGVYRVLKQLVEAGAVLPQRFGRYAWLEQNCNMTMAQSATDSATMPQPDLSSHNLQHSLAR